MQLDYNFPKLNDKQREAVYATEGPVLILAGAGSGKTTVLINRIAYIIGAVGASPYSVLAITFTNKAAGELKNRLVNMLGPVGESVWASTFHSMCVKMLRKDIDKLGYPTTFNIFDRADSMTVVKECLKELNLSDTLFPPKSLLNTFGRAKDELLLPEDFASQNIHDFRMAQIAKIYALYQKKLKAYGALDFDDIIMLTVKLFEENPDVLAYYQHKFQYILVDEYQDTNHAQYRLVTLLAGGYKNLCVVGDDDQSIYKFRGADISNILNFEKQYPNTKIIKLEQNYRSTQNILDVANSVIKNNEERKGKALWTANNEGDKITLYKGENIYEEAQYIIDQIEHESYQNNRKYSEFAVLYRMNAQSLAIENALTRAAIPYKVFGGLRFYDRKEIKDTIAYLRLIMNTNDNVSLRRIINEPKRGIGGTTMEKATEIVEKTNKSLFDVCAESADYIELSRVSQKLRSFCEMILSLSDLVDTLPISEFIARVLNDTGYLSSLEIENMPESITRIENINEFIASAVNFEKSEENPALSSFLESIALVADVDNYDEAEDYVVLMTLHSAKGLEFPVVFLVGMEEGVFPSYQSIGSQADLEEERRLCYVGVTRAKEHLYLTHVFSRTMHGATNYNRRSRFVDEIPMDCLEVYDVPKEQYVFDEQKISVSNVYEKPKETVIKCEAFSVGDKVLHRKFGKGVVQKAMQVGNDYHLEIEFEGVGTKILMAAYAKLEKL